jgi:hypothetical protein
MIRRAAACVDSWLCVYSVCLHFFDTCCALGQADNLSIDEEMGAIPVLSGGCLLTNRREMTRTCF